MANGLCGTCRVVLTEENCSASALKKGFGLCRVCDLAYDKIRPIKIRFCSNEKCGAELTKDSCYPSTLRRGGICKVCSTERNKEQHRANPEKAIIKQQIWRKKNPEKYAIRLRKAASRVYGSTKEEFDFKLLAQNSLCAICGKLLIVPCQDHDHKTKKIRDILCRKCNSLLGYAEENLEILANAIKYLQKHADSSLIQTICVEADNPAFSKASDDGDPVYLTYIKR